MSRAATLISDGIRSTSQHVANILPDEAIINWYPGHMAKASSHIASKINHCSHIIEIRDARVRCPKLSSTRAHDSTTLDSRLQRLNVLFSYLPLHSAL